MVLNRSSLIPNSTVEVECPLRKLEMVSLKRDSLEQKSVIWEATSFSNTFDSTGRIDTGRKSSSVMGVSTFGMGLIRESFQARGKYNFEIQLLMIVVSGPAKCPATRFTNLAGSWPGSVEQSVRSCLRVLRTSLCVTLSKWKAPSLSGIFIRYLYVINVFRLSVHKDLFVPLPAVAILCLWEVYIKYYLKCPYPTNFVFT